MPKRKIFYKEEKIQKSQGARERVPKEKSGEKKSNNLGKGKIPTKKVKKNLSTSTLRKTGH